MMKRALYQYAIWLTTLALITSGATWRPCTAANVATVEAAAVNASAQMQVAADAHAHHGHHSASMQTEPPQATSAGHDSGAPPVQDHACQKCCAMCSITSVLGESPAMQVALIGHPVLFAVRGDHVTSRVLWLDPEIPKSPV